jgi:hypothetical protein
MPFAFAIHSFSVWSPPDGESGRNALRFGPPLDIRGSGCNRRLVEDPSRAKVARRSRVAEANARLSRRTRRRTIRKPFEKRSRGALPPQFNSLAGDR